MPLLCRSEAVLALLCLLACDPIGNARDTAAADASDGVQRDAGSDAGSALWLPWPAEPLPQVIEPSDNRSSEAKRVLGRLLFYDPILSRDNATACVTCHSEVWGLSDQLPRSVGIEGKGPIGPGRSGVHMTRRNSPALWNVALRETLFWDGRVASLEEQALKPLESPEELAIPVADAVTAVAAIDAYGPLFRSAFPNAEPAVSAEHVAQALSVFVRAFVSDRAPYDQYLRGDALAMSAADKRGMALFAEQGCAACHVPPRFESDQYVDRHVPNPEGIVDDGRFEHTAQAADRAAFRVPTLRNLRFSPPYFHNGAVLLFEDAVAHELAEQVAAGKARALEPDELADLIGFLRRSLVDISREQYRPDAVPSGLAIPEDGDRLVRGVHAD